MEWNLEKRQEIPSAHTIDYLQVSEILVNNGQAYGVQVKKGSGVVNVTAPIIISDAGMLELFIHELLTSTLLLFYA